MAIPTSWARDAGLAGEASVSVTTNEPTTFYVVAKLVNVPGDLNGDDIRTHYDLTIDVEQPFTTSGTRSDDGSVFTGGQTNEIDLSVEASESVELPDELREVVGAINEHRSGAALRIIHKTVSDDPGSSFTEGGGEWNDEREQVKHLLGVAGTLGVARRDKKTWYPMGTTTTA